MTRSRRLWILAVLLFVAAGGTAGYATVRAMGVGVALAMGGSDARGEAWRMARNDPVRLRELEAQAKADQAFARKEDLVFKVLSGVAAALALAGIGAGVGAWRSRGLPSPQP